MITRDSCPVVASVVSSRKIGGPPPRPSELTQLYRWNILNTWPASCYEYKHCTRRYPRKLRSNYFESRGSSRNLPPDRPSDYHPARTLCNILGAPKSSTIDNIRVVVSARSTLSALRGETGARSRQDRRRLDIARISVRPGCRRPTSFPRTLSSPENGATLFGNDTRRCLFCPLTL